MTTAARRHVVARNTATASANKIHDDVVARRYGFAGGLVPGVDVYAYMTHPAAAAWGIDWLERGSMRARFGAPVYAGEAVVVVPGPVEADRDGRRMPLHLYGPEGDVRAAGEARLPAVAPPPPPPDRWARIDQPTDPPAASPAALAPGTALALAPHRFRADRAADYLAEVGEDLAVYRAVAVAHPGWILRDANRVLSANVALGPWIHLESVTQHHGVVRDGDRVDTRARVTREWEHRGHRLVELDVGVFVNAHEVIARITHTAIYRPRPGRA
jgi:acyl dehydratase